jgi:adenylate kinase family enzyme
VGASARQRILVVGSGGAGKSTFAINLGKLTGVPVVHLDRHYWRANWTAPSSDEWGETVQNLIALDSWIMDGNYGGSFPARFAAANIVVFLDYPRLICAIRALKRVALRRWAKRPDMADGCHERLDSEFLRWIWDFPKHSRTTVLEAVSKNAHIELVHVRHPRHLPRITEELAKRLLEGVSP